MIQDILKDHKPGDKPRFFLHDEMKEWLKDHLKIRMITAIDPSSDYSLQAKLNLTKSLIHRIQMTVDLLLDGETICSQGTTIHLDSQEQGFKCVANVVENCMMHIVQLQQENKELSRRLQLLEHPIIVK